MQPHFTNSNEVDSAGASSSAFVADIPNRYLRREKMKCLLPPRHPKWTHEKSRVSLALDRAIEYELKYGRKVDPNMDTKTIRRTISNRLSAQRSRKKKFHYLTGLEDRIKELQVIMAGLIPKVEIYREKKRLVQQENYSLRTMVEIRVAESIIAENNLEEKRREILSLKQGLNAQTPNPIAASDQSNPEPYSLEFYAQRLMQMDQSSMMELHFDEEERENEQVDQYLNLEEELKSSSSC